MAGNGASGNIEGFIYIAMNSVYQATVTFVGQNVGAKKYHRINKVFLTCLALVVIIGVVFGFLTYAFGEQLLSLYLDKSPEGFDLPIAYGQERMLYISLTYFLCGVMEVLVGAQGGLGMSFAPMFNAMLGTCALRILWVKIVFGTFNTLASVYISYPVSWVFTSIAHLIFYLVKLKKVKKSAYAEELKPA